MSAGTPSPSTAAPGPRGEDGLLREFETTRTPGQVARLFLESVRDETRQVHLAGASGTEVVRLYTAAVDDLLRALFRYADAEHGRRFPKLNQRITIVARGGYGRAELNPHSDIDLLFLHDYKRGPYVEVVTEIILHALWDARLTVGHGMRTARECVRLANEDLKEKTALIDSRYLAGDEKLYGDLDKLLIAEVLNRNQQKFFKAKLEESRERHAHYGDSIYLLEPQIKEGEGGLRDLHTAMWLAAVKYKVHSVGELVQKAVITEQELAEVRAARDFLWRVRNSLHFLTGRHFDQLTFEMQERIEPILGLKPIEGQPAGSALMRAYYQHASTIYQFAEGLIARVVEGPSSGRFFRRTNIRQIRPGVLIQQNLLTIGDPELFRRDPLNLVNIYADCQAQGVELSGSTYQLVRDNLGLIDDAMRRQPATGAALMKILDRKSVV